LHFYYTIEEDLIEEKSYFKSITDGSMIVEKEGGGKKIILKRTPLHLAMSNNRSVNIIL